MNVGGTVIEAFAYVCELDAARLDEETRLDAIGTDSLVLVAVADFVEDRLDASAAGWRIDDGELGRVRTIGELVRVVERTARYSTGSGRP